MKKCILPWISLSTTVRGKARTCGYAATKMNKNLENIEQDWNSEYFKQIRKDFMAGKEPSNCKKCFYTEQRNVESKRQKENKYWAERIDLEKFWSNTNIDGSINTLPIMLDIRTGNTCNLMCVSCAPDTSSSWNKDKHLLNKFENTKESTISYPFNENTIQFVKDNLEHIQLINLLGGEPLAAKIHKELIELLVEYRHKHNIELRYVTNGTFFTTELFEQWNKLPQVTVSTSVDALFERNEYIRYPSKWETVRQGIEECNKRANSTFITRVLWTCQALNIWSLPETYEYFKTFENIHFDFGDRVMFPEHMSVQALPLKMKEAIVDRLESYGNDAMFYVNYMLEENKSDRDMIRYLNMLDVSRGLNWQKTFPELTKFQIKC